MEDFNRMPLRDLINIWMDLTLPELDYERPSIQYFEKRKQLDNIIATRFGFSHKDTIIFLSNKIRRKKSQEVAEELQAKCLMKIDSKMKDLLYQLEEIDISNMKILELNKSS